MSPRRADPHTLAGAYALDALGEPDRGVFERHLLRCDACRQESAGLREAAARLAAAAAAEPPPRLREQVLAAASQTRQLPPRAAGESLGAPASLRMLGLPAARRMAVALAGLAALVALTVGGMTIHEQHRLRQEQARARAIAAVLNAPDAAMMTARARTGGTATAVMSHEDRALVLTTRRLPALPATECYQVWLMGPRGVRAAGLLPAAHQGITAPVIVSGLAAGDKVALTVEASGGANRPTTPAVLMLDLPS